MGGFAGLAPYLKGFVGALVGALVVAVLYVAWIDHQRITAVWNYVNAEVAAKAQATK